MSEKKGIKETLEILDGLGEIAVSGKKLIGVVKKIMKDGIELTDIVYLGELSDAAPEMEVLELGYKDAKLSLEELKDLDKGEIISIIGKLYEVIDKVSKS